MSQIRNIFIVTAASIAFVACSSEKDNTDNTDTQPGSDESSESGNRFYNSAVKKIQTGPPAVSEKEAKAIVDHMTAGGKIGLGEINSIDFTNPDKTAGYLKAALEAARKAAAE